MLTSEDYYIEDGKVVLTGAYLLKRGFCCGNGCRHCPYLPEIQKAASKRPYKDEVLEKGEFK